jgi:hypothetical protein
MLAPHTQSQKTQDPNELGGYARRTPVLFSLAWTIQYPAFPISASYRFIFVLQEKLPSLLAFTSLRIIYSKFLVPFTVTTGWGFSVHKPRLAQ